uniref:Uncharacterized protein n=1 Tax=Glossina austeni TaxID=7395 RepID=A0A1A9VPA5_GLOAU
MTIGKYVKAEYLQCHGKVTRWHPDFDLENCPDIELAHLPQPPNVQKYSSAKDILLTSRNLFHSNIREGKVMEFDENKQNQTEKTINLKEQQDFNDNSKAETGIETKEENKTADPIKTTDLLKGIPKALLDKIRAKEAANAVEAMTRRPSQSQEAAQYSRLPELARYLRNVFVTERKGVLTQEFIIKKVQNSFRACLSSQEIQHHLQLIAKEMPTWLAFHDVRKTMYLRINKEMELAEVIERLEYTALSPLAVGDIYILNKADLLLRETELIQLLLIKNFHTFANRYDAAGRNDRLGFLPSTLAKHRVCRANRLQKFREVFTNDQLRKLTCSLIPQVAEDLEEHLLKPFFQYM